MAACTPAATNGTTVSCAADSVQTTIVGSGPGNNNVTLNVADSAQINTGTSVAISLGDNAVINLGANALVQNSPTTGSGPWSAGVNTIEFNSNGILNIAAGAQVRLQGTQPQSEAINLIGGGNTITNRGTIFAINGAAVWFNNVNAGGANTIDNYGVIQTGANGGNANVIGSTNTNDVVFINRTGASVIGNLALGGGNDRLTLEAGSTISGSFDGGTGTNSLTLSGATGTTSSLAGSISNFQSLIKDGAGQWTLTGAIGNNGGATPLAVTVNQGTLALTGNNANFNGSIDVNAGGTLEGVAQSLPPSVTNDGLVRFAQGTAGTYAGVISGGGALEKTAAGTLTLTGAQLYTGGTTVSAGTLPVGNGGTSGSLVGNIANNATLTFNRSDASTFAGVLSGSGTLNKLGAGALTLSAAGSSQGSVNVQQGTATFTQAGDFTTTGNYTTQGGATTNIGQPNSTLRVGGAFTQAASSTLDVTLGTAPTVVAGTAALDGNLVVRGFNQTQPARASEVTSQNFTLIHTTGGITGNFVNNPLQPSGLDYLLNSGFISANGLDYNLGFRLAWTQGGQADGTGTFTLGANTSFDVDTPLTNQSGTFASGWDGQSLIKNGDGLLVLSAANTYSGTTAVNGGTLRTGAANAFANSSAVSVASGAALDLNGFNQLANNLSGAGNVTLGSATLTAQNNTDTTFAGPISGAGALVKTGAATLTLAGDGSYTGGTTVSAGTLQVGNGGTSGSLAGNVTNNATLAFNRSDDSAFAGVLSGSGALNKLGAGALTLSAGGSSQGNVNVQQGTVKFMQSGDFTTSGNYTTQGGATTNIGDPDSTLRVGGAFAQSANATLDVTLGTSPTIVASSGALDGNLVIRGFGDRTPPVKATEVMNQNFTLIRTTGGITGNFVNNPLQPSGVDYLLHSGFVSADTLDYNLGFRLTWTQGGQAEADGAFTLGANTAFDVDIPLANQTGPFASGWDGQSLTKGGEGLLVLSGANTYSGTTAINGGTLRTGIANAFATSSAVSVASGATLDLNGFNQLANNLSGAGNVTLGNAALTAQNNADTTFAGPISGTGALVKTGAATLTLTGDSSYTGGTTISAGTLQLGAGGTSGSLVGRIANDGALVINRSNELNLGGVISGSGTLTQAGTGTTTLSAANTYGGVTTVAAGTLKAGAANAFSARSAHTVAGGATLDTAGLNQSVASLTNAGTVNLLSGTAGSTLTVNGAYVGQGGTLRIGTTLGGSGSASDRLVLSGPNASASGTTTLSVTNLGGLGALTTGNGIEVVTALNGATTTAQTSKDAFVLGGGSTSVGLSKAGVAALAAPHIDAGAYEYQLYAADANGQGENWYLRSTTTVPPVNPAPPTPTPAPVVVPTYRAEVPMVAALPAQLRQGDLAMLGNLHRRVGDDDAPKLPGDSMQNSLDRRVWARGVYTDLNIRQEGTVDPQSDGYLNGLQAGIDLWTNASWRTGLYVGFLEGGADVTGDARGVYGRVGYNDLQSRYLGGYATWTGMGGTYADVVLQGGDHRYSVRPDVNPTVSGKANSWTASLEVGQPFALADGWSIEPQAQIAYQKTSISDLSLGGAQVQQQADAGWIGRLGVRLTGDMTTAAGRLQPYGRINLYYASSGADVARFVSPAAITDIRSSSGYTSAEIAGGLTLSLNKMTSLYTEVGHVFDIGGDARVRSSVQGSVGMRLRMN